MRSLMRSNWPARFPCSNRPRGENTPNPPCHTRASVTPRETAPWLSPQPWPPVLNSTGEAVCKGQLATEEGGRLVLSELGLWGCWSIEKQWFAQWGQAGAGEALPVTLESKGSCLGPLAHGWDRQGKQPLASSSRDEQVGLLGCEWGAVTREVGWACPCDKRVTALPPPTLCQLPTLLLCGDRGLLPPTHSGTQSEVSRSLGLDESTTSHTGHGSGNGYTGQKQRPQAPQESQGLSGAAPHPPGEWQKRTLRGPGGWGHRWGDGVRSTSRHTRPGSPRSTGTGGSSPRA